MILEEIRKEKGPTRGCPRRALDSERKGDVQHSQSDEGQIAEPSHWPWLVEEIHTARHEGNQYPLNTKRELGIEVESWILDEEAKPIDETDKGHSAPTREIQLSLPRPLRQRLVGVVLEHSAHDRDERVTNPQQVAHDHSSFQGTFSIATLRQILSFFLNSDNALRIPYMGLKVKPNRKSLYFKAFSGLQYWIKKFSSPKIKIWFEPMFFSGFFCGFERCGSAAFPNFRGGIFSEKCVRTNSRILHHVGNCKFEGLASLRSATNLYSILGVKTNWRFRILGEENFLILNPINL
jgi:hypothetical protein